MDKEDLDFMQSLFTPSFVLEPRKTVLVIVDMQYSSACRTTGLGKIMKEKGQEDVLEWRFRRIEKIALPNIIKLLDFFRKNKLRIIYLTVGSEMPDYSDLIPNSRAFRIATALRNTKGNRVHEILDEIKPLPGECVINKVSAGAFSTSPIERILRAMGIENLLFTGVSTNCCVESTARGANDFGYRCIIVEDGCAGTEEDGHNATIMHARRRMGRVETTEDVIKELSSAIYEL